MSRENAVGGFRRLDHRDASRRSAAPVSARSVQAAIARERDGSRIAAAGLTTLFVLLVLALFNGCAPQASRESTPVQKASEVRIRAGAEKAAPPPDSGQPESPAAEKANDAAAAESAAPAGETPEESPERPQADSPKSRPGQLPG